MRITLRMGLLLVFFYATGCQYLHPDTGLKNIEVDDQRHSYLRLDTRSADLCMGIRNTGSDSININLDELFTIRMPEFIFLRSFNAWRISSNVIEKPILDEDGYLVEPSDSLAFSASYSAHYSFPRRKPIIKFRTIVLRSNEGFSTSIKIWQTLVWGQVLEACEKNSKRKFQLRCNKIEELNAILGSNIKSLTVDMDAATVLKFAKLQANAKPLPRVDELDQLESMSVDTTDSPHRKIGKINTNPLQDEKEEKRVLALIEGRLAYDDETKRLILSLTNCSDYIVTIDLNQHDERSLEVSATTTSPKDAVLSTNSFREPVEDENRILDLDIGDTFLWSFAVSEVDVLPKLQEYFSEDRRRQCYFSTTIQFQVGGKFLSCEPQLPISFDMFQKMTR